MTKEFLISDFLKRIKRPIELENEVEYKLVTVKMNHNDDTKYHNWKKETRIAYLQLL